MSMKRRTFIGSLLAGLVGLAMAPRLLAGAPELPVAATPKSMIMMSDLYMGHMHQFPKSTVWPELVGVDNGLWAMYGTGGQVDGI